MTYRELLEALMCDLTDDQLDMPVRVHRMGPELLGFERNGDVECLTWSTPFSMELTDTPEDPEHVTELPVLDFRFY